MMQKVGRVIIHFHLWFIWLQIITSLNNVYHQFHLTTYSSIQVGKREHRVFLLSSPTCQTLTCVKNLWSHEAGFTGQRKSITGTKMRWKLWWSVREETYNSRTTRPPGRRLKWSPESKTVKPWSLIASMSVKPSRLVIQHLCETASVAAGDSCTVKIKYNTIIFLYLIDSRMLSDGTISTENSKLNASFKISLRFLCVFKIITFYSRLGSITLSIDSKYCIATVCISYKTSHQITKWKDFCVFHTKYIN